MASEPPKHAWSLNERGMEISDGEAAEFGAQLMSVDDAERSVEGLRAFALEAVGEPAWMAQHEALERLNLQAHQSAQARSDEFVLEAFLTFEKLRELVRELLVAEAWRERVLPRVRQTVAGDGRGMRAYFVLYHEAIVMNLLEVLCFHAHVCEALGDALVDLVRSRARAPRRARRARARTPHPTPFYVRLV